MRGLVLIAALWTTIGNANLLDHDFDHVAEEWLEKLHIPAFSVGVVRHGAVETKGYGFSHLGPNVKATPDTLYFTGSTTKAFTAAAAAKIVHNNSKSIKWTTPMSQLLPGDFVLSDDYATSHITLEDALSHRSGLPAHDGAYGWNNASATDIVRTMRHLPFSAEPRTRFQYNNMMYVAAGLWVERFTGNVLGDVLEEWFWKPLGMSDTTFSIEQASRLKDVDGNDRLARGYYWTGEFYVPIAQLDLVPLAGAGATISSVNDYMLWAQALLAAAKGKNSSSPVTKAIFDATTTPRTIVLDSMSRNIDILGTSTYAFGWVVMQLDTHTVYAHSGGLPGFGANIFVVPDLDLAFVTMGNAAGTSNELGTILFGEVMRSLEEQNEAELLSAKVISKAISRLDVLNEKERVNVDKSRNASSSLPGNVSDYLGLYSHPAYGLLNISMARSASVSHQQQDTKHQQPLSSMEAPLTLNVTPTSRFVPIIYTLAHTHDTFFAIEFFWVSGAEGLPSCAANGARSNEGKGRQLQCKNEIAYEREETARAAFALGIDGGVESLGIEIESELVRYAREEKLGWREGMVWFEKV